MLGKSFIKHACNTFVFFRLCLVRWTRYNPYYLEPEPRKDVYSIPESELSPKQMEEKELKALRPIKAAKSSATSSPFDDPMIR